MNNIHTLSEVKSVRYKLSQIDSSLSSLNFNELDEDSLLALSQYWICRRDEKERNSNFVTFSTANIVDGFVYDGQFAQPTNEIYVMFLTRNPIRFVDQELNELPFNLQAEIRECVTLRQPSQDGKKKMTIKDAITILRS